MITVLLAIIAAALVLLVVILGMTHDELKRVADAAEEANRLTSQALPKDEF